MIQRRPAAAGDLPAIAALDLVLFGPDAWSEESWGVEIDNPRRHLAVATEEDGELVGYAVTLLPAADADPAELLRLGVDPAFQRRGVGSRLLTDAVTAARGSRMLLEVAADNVTAIKLYLRQGFAVIDWRPQYYRSGADAVIMQR